MSRQGDGADRFNRRLAALTAKARAAQAQGPMDVDWDRPVRRPFWLPRRVAASAITHFQRGELATARQCRALRGRLDLAATQEFLDLQAEDEQRHAQIYELYLDRLGGPTPGPLPIDRIYQQALAWRGAPQAIVLAFHGILEGESLRMQHAIDQWLPCPLFRDISTIIARDEARHIAFGRLYLRDTLPHLPHTERLAILRWARALWMEAVGEAISSFAPPGLVGRRGGLGGWMTAAWADRLDDMETLHLFSADERPEFAAQC